MDHAIGHEMDHATGFEKDHHATGFEMGHVNGYLELATKKPLNESRH
jgi:hypothetical protein